jgi:hypothetical protein
MQAKREEDGAVDIEYLASMRGRKGMPCDPQPLPEWAMQERIENDGR